MTRAVFEIKVPINRSGVKKRWIRIGSATAFDGDHGEGLACTIDAVPLNWDGVFFIFPSGKSEIGP